MVLSVLHHGDGPTRIGLITTRKIGNAVVRNQFRRRLRELFRTAYPQLRSGLWMVVIARHKAPGASVAELQQEWQKLARRAGLLQAEAS
jgi:ribonuclease P protein component